MKWLGVVVLVRASVMEVEEDPFWDQFSGIEEAQLSANNRAPLSTLPQMEALFDRMPIYGGVVPTKRVRIRRVLPNCPGPLAIHDKFEPFPLTATSDLFAMLTKDRFLYNPIRSPAIDRVLYRLLIPAPVFRALIDLNQEKPETWTGEGAPFSLQAINWYYEHILPLRGSCVVLSEVFTHIRAKQQSGAVDLVTVSELRLARWIQRQQIRENPMLVGRILIPFELVSTEGWRVRRSPMEFPRFDFASLSEPQRAIVRRILEELAKGADSVFLMTPDRLRDQFYPGVIDESLDRAVGTLLGAFGLPREAVLSLADFNGSSRSWKNEAELHKVVSAIAKEGRLPLFVFTWYTALTQLYHGYLWNAIPFKQGGDWSKRLVLFPPADVVMAIAAIFIRDLALV